MALTYGNALGNESIAAFDGFEMDRRPDRLVGGAHAKVAPVEDFIMTLREATMMSSGIGSVAMPSVRANMYRSHTTGICIPSR